MTTHYDRYQARTRRMVRIQLLATMALIAFGAVFTAAAAFALIILTILVLG